MTIGELIFALEGAKPDACVYFSFGGVSPGEIDSWRGVYAEAALGFSGGTYASENVLVSTLLKELNKAIDGRTYDGWKGGEYCYSKGTPLHIDNRGCCTHTEIQRVELNDYAAIIHTEYEE